MAEKKNERKEERSEIICSSGREKFNFVSLFIFFLKHIVWLRGEEKKKKAGNDKQVMLFVLEMIIKLK